MMLRLLILSVGISVAVAMTSTSGPPSSTTAATAVKILYDMKHHKAMIVRADGCYEYHLDHHDVEATEHDSTKAVLEARMLAELATAINIQESGHHHIDHMTQEIRTACTGVPVYQWETPNAGN